MLVSPEEASEVVVILGKFIIIKPWSKSEPVSQLTPKSNQSLPKKEKRTLGPWADTIFSFLHVELQINFPWTFGMYKDPESTHNKCLLETIFPED